VNIYLIIIITIIVADYILDLIVENLNIRHSASELPEEFAGYYDAEKYKKSQDYLKERTGFSLIETAVFKSIVLVFILSGGFNIIDQYARSFGQGSILTGLIFAGILMLGSSLIGIPFSACHTFVIEEKFGFNRTTVKTFILDLIKAWILMCIIGGIIYSGIIWFFDIAGKSAWLYCWICVTVFQLFLTFIAPVVILPIFNKFIPLEDGELKNAINEYAGTQNFTLSGIFKMDGSKRSSKSNAFFTGFGKFRRIALFDTLIEKHTVEELVSVLAHEIGHYKKKHILKSIIISIITGGVMFFILSQFINNPGLFDAFKMNDTSVYASLFFFGFLYTPIIMILSIAGNIFSRKNEYEADQFAMTTYGKPESFINALKKLSVDNLSNLTPHPVKVFLDYSHPPVLNRIEAIKKIKGEIIL
jgi:STE24 endopeptidase